MGKIVRWVILAVALGALQSNDRAFAQSTGRATATRPASTDLSAQTRRRPARARTRIRVAPIYPYRTISTPYPVPYEYEYPGPGAVRQCTSRLVQEVRPSGTVIVPRMRCWWER
jgi:hypothetical protein